MRFRNLDGLVDLPIDSIRHRFRNEQVLTVLPVHGSIAGRSSLLVALPESLAVIARDAQARDRWMTAFASWDDVRIGEVESEDGTHYLAVDVGRLRFHGELWGPKGERALRDFVIVAQAQHEALAASA